MALFPPLSFNPLARHAATLTSWGVLSLLGACSASGGDSDYGHGAAGAQHAGNLGPGETGGSPSGSQDGAVPVEQEVCGNGIDDDSDGYVDESCGCEVGTTQPCFVGDPALAGKGICAMGSQTCVTRSTSNEFTMNVWDECVGSGSPGFETCDGLDNDCNGSVDDGCSCEEGSTIDCSTACGAAQQVCVGGTWTSCNAKQPSPEVCDGVDNDCNGMTDEWVTQSCSSVCGTGKRICVLGVWTPCDAPTSCSEPCGTVVCQGTCCPAGAACCGNGACPDAQGQCPTTCPTVICDGVCCPAGNQCCNNGACPDPTTGQCSDELDQCAGKPEVEVYAHSGYTLYRVDPDTKAMSSVGMFAACGGQIIDIAIDKSGVMYGTTASAVHRIDKNTAKCTQLASGTGYPNSLSFVPEGTVFANKEALVGYAGGTYVVIDTQTGQMTSKLSLPSGYSSSGDLVSIAGVGTYLSVNGNGCADCLLEVNPATGQMIQKVGALGYPSVWGLAYWKGTLYGFTSGGAFFTFDLVTKAGQAVNGQTGFHFNGAGSTTCAPQL